MLMPYFVRYRLSSCFNLAQGKLPQRSEQYLPLLMARRSQFLILQVVRHPLLGRPDHRLPQPGQVFLSRMYAQQRRQFIPQGAIRSVGIAVVFLRSVAVMASRQCTATGYMLQSPRPTRDCRT